MHARLTVLAATLAVSPTLWAATSNVDIYGAINIIVPTSGVYSAAADIGNNIFSQSPFVPSAAVTETAGQTAAITLPDYSAQARTTLGSNHAFVQANGFSNGAFAIGSFSGWYDQITITGGTGAGTVQFSVRLNGLVTAGAHLGLIGYGLLASSVHPTQLSSDSLSFNVLHASVPWGLDSTQVTEIALYDIVVSPYSDPNQLGALFEPSAPGTGIPAIPSPHDQLGNDAGMGFPAYVPDLILVPGGHQPVNVTLTGTLEFTYGEAFYLIGALGTAVMGNGLQTFTPFEISDSPATSPTVDGTGPTTLDFANSAHLVGIVLPEGANLSSAAGAAYNVTAVPEPGEWVLMLAGLGLVGWRVRRRA